MTFKVSEVKKTYEDGKEQTYLSNVLPLKSLSGEVIGKANITLNITHQQEQIDLKVKELEEKARICKVYAAAMAHEMRTPIATIGIMARNLESVIPSLLTSYELAASKNLIEDDLSGNQIAMVRELSIVLREIADNANKDIDMMLAQITQEDATPRFELLSMNDVLARVLSAYPFIGDEIHKVDFEEGRDFEFNGDYLFYKHIIFNLVKNALYYIKASNKKSAKVDIWLEPGVKYNIVNFRDTANGIPADILPHIFESFYTNRTGGTGVGLSLCKDFMKKMDGDIDCESVEGEYTHFRLYFPKIEKDQ